MERIIKGAMRIIMDRRPRKHTRLQVLDWMVRRFQMAPRTASK